jgi:hypothetical protein
MNVAFVPEQAGKATSEKEVLIFIEMSGGEFDWSVPHLDDEIICHEIANIIGSPFLNQAP